jgi:hypothetical protein
MPYRATAVADASVKVAPLNRVHVASGYRRFSFAMLYRIKQNAMDEIRAFPRRIQGLSSEPRSLATVMTIAIVIRQWYHELAQCCEKSLWLQ